MIALDVAGGPAPPPEVRSAGNYTDQQLASWMRAVTGSVRTGALAGLQVAAGAVARAFAAAAVEGDDGLLDPLLLYDAGFDLVTRGEAVYLLGAGRGGLTLTRASTGTAVYGGPEPDTWRYTITAPGPSTTETTFAPAARVLHVRQNAAPEAPWRGRSGLQVAAASGALASSLAASLTAEGEVPHARVIPQPQGQSQVVADNLRAAISDGLRLALPETTNAGGGAGRIAAPQTDWKPYRLGGDWSEASVRLQALALQETAGVCGLPAPLVPGASSAGPAMREAFRQFLVATVVPLARILEAEATRVLERPVVLQHHDLAAADVAGRARAVGTLVENGVDRERALTLVGWGA